MANMPVNQWLDVNGEKNEKTSDINLKSHFDACYRLCTKYVCEST